MLSPSLRVADAPRLGIEGFERDGRRGLEPVLPRAADIPRGRAGLYYLLVTLLLITFLAMFGPRAHAPAPFFVYARYALWPLALLSIGLTIQRYGPNAILTTIKPVLPFFVVGIFAALLGYDIVRSAKALIFWIIGISAAAAIGFELPPDSVRRYIVRFFLFACIVSLALAIAVPSYGTAADTRSESGTVWLGAFVHKNIFGEVAAYLLVLTCVTSVPRGLRVVSIGTALICLVMAGSQGAVASAGATLLLVLAIAMLRRFGLSSGVQVAVLATAAVAGMLMLVFGLSALLGALGRDPTLTGRTTIWATFLPRALYFWMIGAGPGMFTSASFVTFDLTQQLRAFGSIDTPHNMYIAAIGEAGFPGLVTLILPLGYFGLVLPFTKSGNRHSVPTAAMALIMLVSGLNETHEVYGPAIRMALVLLFYAGLLRSEAADRRQSEAPRPTAGPDDFPIPVARSAF